jgi:hypothetical protein
LNNGCDSDSHDGSPFYKCSRGKPSRKLLSFREGGIARGD